MKALGQRGSAPVEFVLVSGLLVATVLGLMQLSLVIHVRHTLVASAQEGARWAGYHDTSLAEGVALTRRLISQGLSEGYAGSVSATPVTINGRPHIRMNVVSPFPAVGLWSGGGEIRVWADAPLERPRS